MRFGVFARRIAGAVQARCRAEVEVGIRHRPDAAAFAQQCVPGAAQVRHQIVHAAISAVGQEGVGVGRGVAAAVRFHLVAHHAFDGEEHVRRQVVHLAQLRDGVLARIARRMVQQHVAVGMLVAQPFQRGQGIGMRGERAGFAGQARHQQRIEQGGVAVGEEVFEFRHRLQRLGG
ncbi:hypothetical protein D3C72_1597310 [compost metagenome]